MSVQELFLSAFAGAGKAPVIQMIALGTARSLAISIGPSGLGVKRINRAIGGLKQLVDDRALAGLDDHCQRCKAGDSLTLLLPAFQRMRKINPGHNLASAIDDDSMMVMLRPVRRRVKRPGKSGNSTENFLDAKSRYFSTSNPVVKEATLKLGL